MLGVFTKETEDVILLPFFFFSLFYLKEDKDIPYRCSTFPSNNMLNNNNAKMILNDQERQTGADK